MAYEEYRYGNSTERATAKREEYDRRHDNEAYPNAHEPDDEEEPNEKIVELSRIEKTALSFLVFLINTGLTFIPNIEIGLFINILAATTFPYLILILPAKIH